MVKFQQIVSELKHYGIEKGSLNRCVERRIAPQTQKWDMSSQLYAGYKFRQIQHIQVNSFSQHLL